MKTRLIFLCLFLLASATSEAGYITAECSGEMVEVSYCVTGLESLAEMESLVVVAHYMGTCEPDIVFSAETEPYPPAGETVCHDFSIPNPAPNRAFLYELKAVDSTGQYHSLPAEWSPIWGSRPYHFPCGCENTIMARGILVMENFFMLCEGRCWFENFNFSTISGDELPLGTLVDLFGHFTFSTTLPHGFLLTIDHFEVVTDAAGCGATGSQVKTFGALKSYYR